MFLTDGDGNVSNQFSNGNPGTGTPATQVNADWLNAIQNELALVVTSAGAALNKADSTQVNAAVGAKIAAALAQGAVVYPSLAVGAFQTGQRKLGYWIDAQGCLHIEGFVGSLGSSAAGQVVWNASAVPSRFCPGAAQVMSLPCVANANAAGMVTVYADGRLAVGVFGGANILSASVSVVINPNVAIA